MLDFNALVQQHIQGLDFGTVQLVIKVHRGSLSKVEIARATSVKIDGNNPDADAAGVIISALKSKQGSLSDESIGFSVLRRHGKPVQVQVQEFIQENSL